MSKQTDSGILPKCFSTVFKQYISYFTYLSYTFNIVSSTVPAAVCFVSFSALEV